MRIGNDLFLFQIQSRKLVLVGCYMFNSSTSGKHIISTSQIPKHWKHFAYTGSKIHLDALHEGMQYFGTCSKCVSSAGIAWNNIPDSMQSISIHKCVGCDDEFCENMFPFLFESYSAVEQLQFKRCKIILSCRQKESRRQPCSMKLNFLFGFKFVDNDVCIYFKN